LAILTLISDIGYNNHDLSRFRLRVRQQLPGAELEIINAAVARHDIAEAAYVLDCVLPDFPPDTVHLVDIRADLNAFGPGLVARVKDQWVIAANNGLLSLLYFKSEKV
jgi:S-adenosylmethionine hydrolase